MVIKSLDPLVNLHAVKVQGHSCEASGVSCSTVGLLQMRALHYEWFKNSEKKLVPEDFQSKFSGYV